MDTEFVENLKKKYAGPMSEEEVTFLRDIQGLIDFSLRNGLGFNFVMSALGHDINGLFRYGNDIKAAAQDGFTPKSEGYSKLGPEWIGEPEEVHE